MQSFVESLVQSVREAQVGCGSDETQVGRFPTNRRFERWALQLEAWVARVADSFQSGHNRGCAIDLDASCSSYCSALNHELADAYGYGERSSKTSIRYSHPQLEASSNSSVYTVQPHTELQTRTDRLHRNGEGLPQGNGQLKRNEDQTKKPRNVLRKDQKSPPKSPPSPP
jgi:hypothetical protein